MDNQKQKPYQKQISHFNAEIASVHTKNKYNMNNEFIPSRSWYFHVIISHILMSHIAK